MGDKETRKRKKRRESAKKEETDDSSPPREAVQDVSGKKKVEDHSSSHNLNEPSILAKLVFCVLFMLLMSAVGLIFYALNEATKSSDIVEGVEEEIVRSTSLPVIDDLPSSRSPPDVASDDEEGEEGHLAPSIEEIINSIEESVTYNIDEDNSGHQEIYVDNLNNEEELSDAMQSEEPVVTEVPNAEIVVQQESVISTPTAEDLFLPSSVESTETPIKPPSQNEDLFEINEHEAIEEIESTTNLPVDAVHSNPDVIEKNPNIPDQAAFLDDLDNEDDNDAEEEPKSSESLNEASSNIQPSLASQINEPSQGSVGKQDSEVRESVDQPEEIPEAASQYENEDITNDYDFLFREELDEGDKLIEKSLENARKWFDSLLARYPKSPRATYSKACILDKMAEEKRLNSILESSIEFYKKTMSLPEVPQKLYFLAGNRAVDRLRFRGMVGKALTLQSEMADMFPNDIHTQNQLAVSFMWMGKNSEAKSILRDVLKKDPNSGFAKVHLGFILKIDDNNYDDAIKFLSEGIASKEGGVIDGRFYFHLGDALHRSGFPDKAMKVYEEGVTNGLFLSTLQRSLYNVKGLLGKPWWEPEETPYLKDFKALEGNWIGIRNEALSLLSEKHKGFEREAEGLMNTGDWQQFNLFLRGQKLQHNCRKAPRTCDLIDSIPKAAKCKRGQAKFSIMQPGTHVWAHTGPTNCRLRSHLGLVVPKGPRIRVGNETREWKEGKVMIFDDSFEHEVWHNGDSHRIVLILDFWHPELSDSVIKTLTPI